MTELQPLDGAVRGTTADMIYMEDRVYYLDSMREYFPHFEGLHDIAWTEGADANIDKMHFDFNVVDLLNNRNHKYFAIDGITVSAHNQDDLIYKSIVSIECSDDVERVGHVKWTAEALPLVTVLIIAHDLKYVYDSFFNEKSMTPETVKQLLLKDGLKPYMERAYSYLLQLKTIDRQVDEPTYEKLLDLIK